MFSNISNFFNVVLSEVYDCSTKLRDIYYWKVVAAKNYLRTDRIKKELKKKMKHAFSYNEWKTYADQFDQLKDIQIWKETHNTSLYDWEYIKNLTESLRTTRQKGEIRKLMMLIRTNSIRNLANTLSPILYSKSYVGTKSLIEDFQAEMVECFNYVANYPSDKLSGEKKMEFFAETRRVYGRTALIFSGGANLGFFHYGVLRSLYEEKLLPRIIAGSSVGSIFAAFICTKKWEEMKDILIPENIKLIAFHKRDNRHTWKRKVKRFLREGVLLDIAVIKEFIRDNIGDVTFQEAFDRTGWILNITVTGYGEHDGWRLLNYLTAPDVVIWSAVCASCGLPYIYGPVDLYYKTENGTIEPYKLGNKKFIDGSIGADLPMQNLSELFNVNYFIVSQTNPWVVPFLNESEIFRHSRRVFLYKIFEGILGIIGSELKFRVNQLVKLGLLPKFLLKYSNLVTQQYGGHITIWPNPSFYDFLHLLDNPTHEWIRYVVSRGTTRVYHKMNHIAAVQVIERALERCYLFSKKAYEKEKVLLIAPPDRSSDESDTNYDSFSDFIKSSKTEGKPSEDKKLYKNVNSRLSSFDLLKIVDDKESSS